MSAARFFPFKDGGLTIEPLDRSDEVRGPNPYRDRSVTYRVRLTPEAVAWYRWQLWVQCGWFVVGLGLVHPFEWWEGATGASVTAATWPG